MEQQDFPCAQPSRKLLAAACERRNNWVRALGCARSTDASSARAGVIAITPL